MDSGSNNGVYFLNYKEILAAGDALEFEVAREGNMAVYQKDGRLLSTWKGSIYLELKRVECNSTC